MWVHMCFCCMSTCTWGRQERMFTHVYLCTQLRHGIFFEEHGMKLAAETEYLPSCLPEHRQTAGSTNDCCGWQSTPFLPWPECPCECVLSQKEAHCVFVPTLAWASTVVGHPELCLALQLGAWQACGVQVALYVSIPAAFTWQGVIVEGRAHSRLHWEIRELYSTLTSSVRYCVSCSLLLLNYNCSSLWWGRNLASKKVFATDWQWVRGCHSLQACPTLWLEAWELNVLSEFTVLCWDTFLAILRHVQLASHGSDMPMPGGCLWGGTWDGSLGRHLNRCLPLA